MAIASHPAPLSDRIAFLDWDARAVLDLQSMLGDAVPPTLRASVIRPIPPIIHLAGDPTDP